MSSSTYAVINHASSVKAFSRACPTRSAGRQHCVTVRALTPEQGAVLASVAFTGLTNQWASISVVKARKEYGVPYPALYATGESENANKFNCVQRGHQNMLEQLPIFIAAQLCLATMYPATAAVIGFVWTVGRIVYFLGYAKGDPNGRLPGAITCGLTTIGLLLSLGVIGTRAVLGV